MKTIRVKDELKPLKMPCFIKCKDKKDKWIEVFLYTKEEVWERFNRKTFIGWKGFINDHFCNDKNPIKKYSKYINNENIFIEVCLYVYFKESGIYDIQLDDLNHNYIIKKMVEHFKTKTPGFTKIFLNRMKTYDYFLQKYLNTDTDTRTNNDMEKVFLTVINDAVNGNIHLYHPSELDDIIKNNKYKKNDLLSSGFLSFNSCVNDDIFEMVLESEVSHRLDYISKYATEIIYL
jgi:hypothetical protein